MARLPDNYFSLTPEEQERARERTRGSQPSDSGYFNYGTLEWTPFTPHPTAAPAPTAPAAPAAPAAGAPAAAPAAGKPAAGYQNPYLRTGGALDLDQLQQDVAYNPANPGGAFRNVLTDMGIPASLLMRKGALSNYFNAFAPTSFYQFLADAARQGFDPSAASFKNYLSDQLSSGFRMGNMQPNLDYIRGLGKRLPTSGEFEEGAFANPAEAMLAGFLTSQPYDAIANLLLGQMAGTLPPALMEQYLAPMMEFATQRYADTAGELTGRQSIFDVLSPFLFGGNR